MSMSQEEIESLMNGLDFKDDDSSSKSEEKKEEPQGNMSEDDINDLIAQTEDSTKGEDEAINKNSLQENDILNNIEDTQIEDENTSEETNIDDIIKAFKKVTSAVV